MPYKKRKQKCKQSDGDAGSYVLSYTDKKGKKRRACHTSKKKMQGQIAAIEAESKKIKVTKQELVEIINNMLLEDTSAGDIAAAVLGGPLGYGYKKATEFAADKAKKNIIDPLSDELKEEIPKLLNDLARNDSTVKRVLSSSDSEIVKYLFDNLPTPTRSRSVKLYDKDHIKIVFIYSKREKLYVEITVDGPGPANIELKYNIEDLLFEDLTSEGIEVWATRLHGDVFSQIKNVAINFVGQEEFKKHKRQTRSLIQKSIVDDKEKILSGKSQAMRGIAKVFDDNPSYLLALQAGNVLTKLDIPGDWQEDWEDEAVSYIQKSIGKALKQSDIGKQIGDALDDLNEMVEEMHELKRKELEKLGAAGKAVAYLDRITEGNDTMKITRNQLRQIIQEELAKLPPYKNYQYGVDQISKATKGQEDIIGHT